MISMPKRSTSKVRWRDCSQVQICEIPIRGNAGVQSFSTRIAFEVGVDTGLETAPDCCIGAKLV